METLLSSRSLGEGWTAAQFLAARETLARAEYTAGGIRELMGSSPQAQALSSLASTSQLAFTGDTAIEVLTRLFQHATSEPLATVSQHLDSPTVDEWVAAGVLSLDGGDVRSNLMLTPHGRLVIASDWSGSQRASLQPDHVMGIGSSSESLLYLMFRHPVRTLLDLGTGSGVLALNGSEHAQRVVATDLNPRAIDIATFNARLNQVDRVEIREEDFFAPNDERFDQIICNPPFVVSPEERYLFRDSGEHLCQNLLRSVVDRLERGGFAQILCNWPLIADESPVSRARQWTEELPADIVVLASDPMPAAEYARTWVSTTEPDAAQHAARYLQWMDYYTQHGISHIAHGLFSLRRSPIERKRTHFVYQNAPARMTVEAAADLRRSFDLHDFLADTNDATLLTTRLRLASGARLRQVSEAIDGEWKTQSVELYRRRGLQAPAKLNRDLAAMLARFTGERTVGEDFEALAQFAGGTGAVVTAVRQAIERGYLWPVDLPH